MTRSFSFTKNEAKEIIDNSYSLLQRHNNVLSKTKRRLLKIEDERFISGCKSNMSYGSQDKLSGKQLKKLETVCKKYDKIKPISKQDKLKQIIANLN